MDVKEVRRWGVREGGEETYRGRINVKPTPNQALDTLEADLLRHAQLDLVTDPRAGNEQDLVLDPLGHGHGKGEVHERVEGD